MRPLALTGSRARRRHHRRLLAADAREGRPRLDAHNLEDMRDLLRIDPDGEPEVGAVRRIEITRRDARHGRADFGEADRLADDRGSLPN
jgi:hypothetical protein